MFPMRDMMWECCFDPILFEYCLEVDVSTESRSMKRLNIIQAKDMWQCGAFVMADGMCSLRGSWTFI